MVEHLFDAVDSPHLAFRILLDALFDHLPRQGYGLALHLESHRVEGSIGWKRRESLVDRPLKIVQRPACPAVFLFRVVLLCQEWNRDKHRRASSHPNSSQTVVHCFASLVFKMAIEKPKPGCMIQSTSHWPGLHIE